MFSTPSSEPSVRSPRPRSSTSLSAPTASRSTISQEKALLWFILTLGLNIYILSRGLVKGIEMAAKIGVPLLVLFGIVLAIRGLTLPADAAGIVQSPLAGLNFVWEPNLGGLANPKTWLAAAGQVFFTLSVGMGSIHCYAAYLRQKDDIAVNAMAAGWTNECIEIVLGSAILIPIATAYLGLAAVQQATSSGSGFALGFLTLPTLFNNWGGSGPWPAPCGSGSCSSRASPPRSPWASR